MTERRQPYSPEAEERERLVNQLEDLARKHKLWNYEASPLFKTTPPPEGRLFANVDQIAAHRGYKLESIDMEKNSIIEGFWSDLFKAKQGDNILNLYKDEYKHGAKDINPRTNKLYYNKDRESVVKRTGHIFGTLGSGALMDPDIPALIRNKAVDAVTNFNRKDLKGFVDTSKPSTHLGKIQMHPDALAKETNAFLRSANITNYGNPNYGKVRMVHPGSKSRQVLKVNRPDTVSAETNADAARRADIYRTGPYRSIRGESIEQTEKRLINEVRSSIVKKNIKGGAMADDASIDIARSLNATEESIVTNFVNNLLEVDGALGSQFTGPATPPPAQDKAEQIYTKYVGTKGSTQIPRKSPEGQRLSTSPETPALVRKAISGDKAAQASIERGEKSLESKPKWIDPQHSMSSAELAAKGYMDFTGKR